MSVELLDAYSPGVLRRSKLRAESHPAIAEARVIYNDNTIANEDSLLFRLAENFLETNAVKQGSESERIWLNIIAEKLVDAEVTDKSAEARRIHQALKALSQAGKLSLRNFKTFKNAGYPADSSNLAVVEAKRHLIVSQANRGCGSAIYSLFFGAAKAKTAVVTAELPSIAEIITTYPENIPAAVFSGYLAQGLTAQLTSTRLTPTQNIYFIRNYLTNNQLAAITAFANEATCLREVQSYFARSPLSLGSVLRGMKKADFATLLVSIKNYLFIQCTTHLRPLDNQEVFRFMKSLIPPFHAADRLVTSEAEVLADSVRETIEATKCFSTHGQISEAIHDGRAAQQWQTLIDLIITARNVIDDQQPFLTDGDVQDIVINIVRQKMISTQMDLIAVSKLLPLDNLNPAKMARIYTQEEIIRYLTLMTATPGNKRACQDTLQIDIQALPIAAQKLIYDYCKSITTNAATGIEIIDALRLKAGTTNRYSETTAWGAVKTAMEAHIKANEPDLQQLLKNLKAIQVSITEAPIATLTRAITQLLPADRNVIIQHLSTLKPEATRIPLVDALRLTTTGGFFSSSSYSNTPRWTTAMQDIRNISVEAQRQQQNSRYIKT